jgi:hypothetical protein
MKFEEIKTGEIFNLGSTPSYPKLKTDSGYVDMRDGIVNGNPNQAVLTASIKIMTVKDIAKQFNENEGEAQKWIDELKEKYL